MRDRHEADAARGIARAIGERLSYANVVATLALFGVLAGGGAYAASQIGPKDIAKNAVRAKHIKIGQVKAKHVAKGAVQTPKLADGAVTAAKLADGLEPFPSALPSGKTLTGVYSVTGVASADDEFFDTPISFGFRFAAPPAVVTVGITDTAEEAAAAGCPGTAADPQAAPGAVCIYEMGRENTTPIPGTQEAGGAVARVAGYAPPTGFFGTATRFGTIVEVLSAAAGNLYSNGVWAATSP